MIPSPQSSSDHSAAQEVQNLPPDLGRGVDVLVGSPAIRKNPSFSALSFWISDSRFSGFFQGAILLLIPWDSNNHSCNGLFFPNHHTWCYSGIFTPKPGRSHWFSHFMLKLERPGRHPNRPNRPNRPNLPDSARPEPGRPGSALKAGPEHRTTPSMGRMSGVFHVMPSESLI